MKLPRVWKTGDAVVIRYRKRALPGRVVLASSNGASLMLGFEGLLGGFLGMMPVLWEPVDRVFRDIIEGGEVQITDGPMP